jgi:hypothetical protein
VDRILKALPAKGFRDLHSSCPIKKNRRGLFFFLCITKKIFTQQEKNEYFL